MKLIQQQKIVSNETGKSFLINETRDISQRLYSYEYLCECPVFPDKNYVKNMSMFNRYKDELSDRQKEKQGAFLARTL